MRGPPVAVWPVSNGRGLGWKAGARRAEGPPQESRELPAKEGEALVALMGKQAPLPVPGPDEPSERGDRVGAEAEARKAAVWIQLGE